MGSGSSRLGAQPSRGRVNRRNRIFSSFICGGSSSHAPVQTEDYPTDLVVNPVTTNELQSSIKEPSSFFNSGTEGFSAREEIGTFSGSNNGTIEEGSVEYSSGSIATRNDGKFLSESKELVPDQIFEEGICSSSTSHQEHGVVCANAAPFVGNHADASMDVHGADTVSIPSAVETQVTSESLEESARETLPSAPGLVVPDRERGRRNGNVLHVDLVSISSSILSNSTGDVSNREARRNSRRMFWDAFSRRSSRRHTDSPTIVFSTEDADDLGMHDRWLLDFNGDLFEDGFGAESGYLGSRSHGMHERQRSSRSEIWERLRGGLDDSGRRTSFCASGLHPDGTCSCENFLMTEESGTHASISRIVMLAEALFEVLDEIHRQPMSLSLSMVSVPAPESVVNSFPLKSHKGTAEKGNDVEQCYICLAEYEEEDKIRVLPCRHEYHMACVDKWLKEIHGVCPLCRRNVCEGVAQGTVSNS